MERDIRDNPDPIKKEDDSGNENDSEPIPSDPEKAPAHRTFADHIEKTVEDGILKAKRDRQRQFEEEDYASKLKDAKTGLEMLDLMSEQISGRSAFVPYKRTFPTEPNADPRPDGDQAAGILPLVKPKPASPTTTVADREVLKINSVFRTIDDTAGKEVDVGSKGGKADEGIKGDEPSTTLPSGKAAEGKKSSEVNEGVHGKNSDGGIQDAAGKEVDVGSKGGKADEGINKGDEPSTTLPSGQTEDKEKASEVSEDTHRNKDARSSDPSEETNDNKIGGSGSSESRGTGSSESGRTGSSESDGADSNEEENDGDSNGDSYDSIGRSYTVFDSTGPGIPSINVRPPTPPPLKRQRQPTIHPPVYSPLKREVHPRCQLPPKSPKKK